MERPIDIPQRIDVALAMWKKNASKRQQAIFTLKDFSRPELYSPNSCVHIYEDAIRFPRFKWKIYIYIYKSISNLHIFEDANVLRI